MTNTAKTPLRPLPTFGTQHQLRSDSYSGNFSCHVQSSRNLYLLSSCATHGTALHAFHVRSSFLQMRTTAFLYGIRCPDPSQKRIFPTDFPAPYFTDFNRNGDPKHPDRDTDPGFGFLSQNIFFRTELVSVCLYRLPVDAPVSADSGKPYDKKRYAAVFYSDSHCILRQRHPDSFSRCGRSIYRIPSYFQFTLRKQLLEPGISGTCLLSGQFFQTRRKPGPKKADSSDTSDRYHRQPGHRHASDEL